MPAGALTTSQPTQSFLGSLPTTRATWTSLNKWSSQMSCIETLLSRRHSGCHKMSLMISRKSMSSEKVSLNRKASQVTNRATWTGSSLAWTHSRLGMATRLCWRMCTFCSGSNPTHRSSSRPSPLMQVAPSSASKIFTKVSTQRAVIVSSSLSTISCQSCTKTATCSFQAWKARHRSETARQSSLSMPWECHLGLPILLTWLARCAKSLSRSTYEKTFIFGSIWSSESTRKARRSLTFSSRQPTLRIT